MNRLLAVLCCAAVLQVSPVFAANLTVTSTLADILRPDGTPFPAGTVPPLNEMHGTPLLAKIELFLEIDDLQPGEEGFGAVEFDVYYQTEQQDAPLPIWVIPNPLIDSNGPAPGGLNAQWADVIVNRVDGNNLDRVQAVAMAHWPRTFGPVGVDPRRTTAQNGPEQIATLFVPWDGSSQGQVKLRAKQFSTFNEELLQNRVQQSHERFDFLFRTSSPVFSVFEWATVRWSDPLPTSTMSQTVSIDGLDISVTYEGAEHLVHPPETDSLRLPLNLDFADNSQTLVQAIAFSSPVTNAKFSIANITASESDGFEHVDRVSIVGLLGDAEIMPRITLLREDAQIEGNVVTAVAPDDILSRIGGTVGVAFDTSIDQIRISYGSGVPESVPSIWGRGQFSISEIQFSSSDGDRSPSVPEPCSMSLWLLGSVLMSSLRLRRR